jgi:hypothetical protein
VIFTGTEKATLADPFWLFEFEHRHTNEKFYCIGVQESTQIQRYDQVTITETDTTPDFVNGEITLSEVGMYVYRVYEQDNQVNLDPEQATSQVEVGLMEIIKNPETEDVYEPDSVEGKVYQKDNE